LEQEETLDQATPPESAEPDGKNFSPDSPERRDAYFRYWYPEDATIEIWSGGGDEDISGAIEMALKEISSTVEWMGGAVKGKWFLSCLKTKPAPAKLCAKL